MTTTCLLVVVVILYASVGTNAVTYQCANSSLPNYVLAGNIKCDLDLRAQCGCGSWCGLGGAPTTDDTTPKCVPSIATPDAPPPKPEGGNPCALNNCPFPSFNLVKCPNGSAIYQYIGASCNNISGACIWQLPYCNPIYPPVNARCTKGDGGCPAMPTSPPVGELNVINCTGWWKGLYNAHYECVENGEGGCKWSWVPCPGNTTCPQGMEKFSSFDCVSGETPACQWNTTCSGCQPYPQAQCGPPGTVLFTQDYCGGCNCHVTRVSDGADVCQAQTWQQNFTANNYNQGVSCMTGYRYIPQYPFCTPITPAPTCQTTSCPSGTTCFEVGTFKEQLRTYIPGCYPTPGPVDTLSLPCSSVGCADGYSCVTTASGWVCQLNTGAAQCVANVDCTQASKVTCWNGVQVGGPGCSRRMNGQCEWDYVPCPDYDVPSQGPAAGAINCQVSAWSSWTCGAPCGLWTKQARIRTITQQNNTLGTPCPNLLETGLDCQGAQATGCVTPTTNSVLSSFTSATSTGSSSSSSPSTTSGSATTSGSPNPTTTSGSATTSGSPGTTSGSPNPSTTSGSATTSGSPGTTSGSPNPATTSAGPSSSSATTSGNPNPATTSGGPATTSASPATSGASSSFPSSTGSNPSSSNPSSSQASTGTTPPNPSSSQASTGTTPPNPSSSSPSSSPSSTGSSQSSSNPSSSSPSSSPSSTGSSQSTSNPSSAAPSSGPGTNGTDDNQVSSDSNFYGLQVWAWVLIGIGALLCLIICIVVIVVACSKGGGDRV